MKYVLGEIIQRKMSGLGGIPLRDFQRGELLSRGELFRGNCSGVIVSGGIIQR